MFDHSFYQNINGYIAYITAIKQDHETIMNSAANHRDETKFITYMEMNAFTVVSRCYFNFYMKKYYEYFNMKLIIYSG